MAPRTGLHPCPDGRGRPGRGCVARDLRLQGDNGATVPGPGFTDPQCLAIEILLTLGLVSTILGGAFGSPERGNALCLRCGGIDPTWYVVMSPIPGSTSTDRSLMPYSPSESRTSFVAREVDPPGARPPKEPSHSHALPRTCGWRGLSVRGGPQTKVRRSASRCRDSVGKGRHCSSNRQHGLTRTNLTLGDAVVIHTLTADNVQPEKLTVCAQQGDSGPTDFHLRIGTASKSGVDQQGA